MRTEAEKLLLQRLHDDLQAAGGGPRRRGLSDRLHASLRGRALPLSSGGAACRAYLTELDALHRTELCTSLLFERLERKMRTLEQLRAEAGGDWNETFYRLYFRTLSDRDNRAAYLELARRLPCRLLLRERLTPRAIEAMLLGTSGLLACYRSEDPYIFGLKSEYNHLCTKYDLQPMAVGQWQLRHVLPANHPVLRLTQAAEFFRQDDQLLERTLACRSAEEVQRLFCLEGPAYWQQHYHDAPADAGRKRLGHFKAHIIGINLVAVLQFAYGSQIGNEELRDRALTLLEQLPAEENRYMRAWQQAGLRPRDAFESQALLQLATEHCDADGCDDCPVARRMMRRLRERERQDDTKQPIR